MSWGVWDYPEPPAVTVIDQWNKSHGHHSEEDDFDAEFYNFFREDDEQDEVF